jgi:chromosome segregation ATPase
MNNALPDPLETRLQETEIKLAFLEKELDDSREAMQTLHERLEALEATLDALKRASQNHDSVSDGPG